MEQSIHTINSLLHQLSESYKENEYLRHQLQEKEYQCSSLAVKKEYQNQNNQDINFRPIGTTPLSFPKEERAIVQRCRATGMVLLNEEYQVKFDEAYKDLKGGQYLWIIFPCPIDDSLNSITDEEAFLQLKSFDEKIMFLKSQYNLSQCNIRLIRVVKYEDGVIYFEGQLPSSTPIYDIIPYCNSIFHNPSKLNELYPKVVVNETTMPTQAKESSSPCEPLGQIANNKELEPQVSYHTEKEIPTPTFQENDSVKSAEVNQKLAKNVRGNNSKKQKYKNCKICKRRFSTDLSFKNHQGTHKRPYNCFVCFEGFKTKVLYDSHLGGKVMNGKFSCCACYTLFPKENDLRAHIKTCDFHQKGDGKVKKAYNCCICSKKFINKYNLKRHILSLHLKAKLHKCRKCKKNFTRVDQFQSHSCS